MADQWIDAVGAHPYVQRLDAFAAGYLPAVAIGEQVGQAVQVVGAAGNGRAQVAGGDVPVTDTVELPQQGTVEHLHRLRVGEVDAFLAVGVGDDEARQLRAALDQPGKVIAALVAVARVQQALGGRGGRLGGGGAGALGGLGHDRRCRGLKARHFPTAWVVGVGQVPWFGAAKPDIQPMKGAAPCRGSRRTGSRAQWAAAGRAGCR
ncbi:hypothetical protein D9M70_129560 [compost metagenome]